MTLLAGTSGFAFKEWKGGFYPEGLADADMLSHYGGRLPTVEINNTFYRLPKREVIARWTDAVPASFTFAVKASRRITHVKRLKGVEEPLHYLHRATEVMGERLGAVLFQLPPSLPRDLPRLEAFLAALPADWPVAFELRHDSWRDDDVLDALRARNAALVQSDDDMDALVATADWGYLRLRRPSYAEDELRDHARAIAARGWTRTLVYFKHEEDGPRLADRLNRIAES